MQNCTQRVKEQAFHKLQPDASGHEKTGDHGLLIGHVNVTDWLDQGGRRRLALGKAFYCRSDFHTNL